MQFCDFKSPKRGARAGSRFLIAGTIVMIGSMLSGCAEYLSREDRIAPSVGNAKSHNAAVHAIDPWPRYAFRRSMKTPGVKAEQAMEAFNEKPKASTNGSSAGVTSGK